MPNIVVSSVFSIIDVLITVPASLASRLVDLQSNLHPANSKESSSIQQQRYSLSQCRFRLDFDTSSTLTLPDSRKLSYSTYGQLDPSKIRHNVFMMHGFPGSRMEAAFLDTAASRLNMRVIGVDRPGMGRSTYDPNRTILSFATDIDQLATHLNLPSYGVLGVSGGGPPALACAYALPRDKLKCVAIVCGLGPPDITYKGMAFMNYLGWTYAVHHLPRLCAWWFGRDPQARTDLSEESRVELLTSLFEKSKSSMHREDVKFLGDMDVTKLRVRTWSESFAQGMTGWWKDWTLLANDFGFKVQDIRKDLPVHLWYAKGDGNVPCNHGVEVARRLREGNPKADDGGDERVRLWAKDEETHASIFYNYREEFLSEMARVMEK